MQISINQVLDTYSQRAITDSLANDALFEDGKNTAGRLAKQVKSNLQGLADAVETRGVINTIEKALLANPVFTSAALPHKFARILISRYQPGMYYGPHVDDPIVNGARTDLAFTLFLSDPDSYQGGELVLQKHDGDELIKLPAGSLVLYPATSIHYVADVTAGTRLAAVGWIQSRVRSAEQREILFDLNYALANLPPEAATNTVRLSLLKARNNLVRQWSDI